MMDPHQREQARLSLLRILSLNPTAYGMTVPLLRQYLRAEGSNLTPAEVEAELVYLEDKTFVTRPGKQISPENVCFRVTAAGRDYLATQGF